MYTTALPKTGFTMAGLLALALAIMLIALLMMRSVVLRRI